ncbi:MAG: phosphatidylglycerophosphatase A [Pseudomonadota bacterium]
MIKLCKITASFLGLGYLPWMPGTWGTIGAACLSLFFLKFSPFVLLLITFITTIVGFYVSNVCLKTADSLDMDPGWIVIDEVAGFFWAISLISLIHPLDYVQLVLAFIFFRIFDIMKPWPISWIDRTLANSSKTAALGIMLDDVLAGIFAALFTLFASRMLIA